MAANIDDVLSQLGAAGLIVDRALEVGKLKRCKIEGDREKRGWYLLHEWQRDDGQILLVGSYGIWRGAENNAQKIELRGVEVSKEQAAALKAKLAEDRKKAAAYEKAVQAKAAERAERMWRKCEADGESDYLARKGVPVPYGVRFTENGAVVIPMMDTVGRVHGLQFILNTKNPEHKKRIGKTGRDKEYWPAGLAKKGHFHLIGMPTSVCMVVEGYATGASLHLATGLPVAVAFDAGNLQPVSEALKKRYPGVNFLICADDDRFGSCISCKGKITDKAAPKCPHCGEDHKTKNGGFDGAVLASLSVSGAWIAPRFSDEAARQLKFEETGAKISDFNDLHAIEGLHTVRLQIENKLRELGWMVAAPMPRATALGGEGKDGLQPIQSYDELISRFSLIYGGGGTVFDHSERAIVSLSDMRDACTSKEISRRWQESLDRKIVRADEVGFDPTEKDPLIKCNLWGGWPTSPKSGVCDELLDLLKYLCTEEDDPLAVWDWVIKWLAYPIQNPGAKMKTALVFHGPQGAGKNMFFEAVAKIYGRYGLVVDQDAVEDKFNSIFSAKLFLIADEVVARQELYHTKNKLKGFITGDTIRINPKNIAARTEKNQLNVVFLSNESQPLVLEELDRRYMVVWVPEKLPPHYYSVVKREIDAGGVEALHEFLLNYPLGDFAPHTLPPMTKAKKDLIDMSLNSTERFWLAFKSGQIDGITPMPIRSEDFGELYRVWCSRNGIKNPAPNHILTGSIGKRSDAHKDLGRYLAGAADKPKQCTFIFPLDQKSPPPGKTQPVWLGDCVTDMRRNLSDYRGRE